MLVRVNNHYTTCLFWMCIACGWDDWYIYMGVGNLVVRYDNKKPISVVTDGDWAMKKAIKKLILEAQHHLCVCHLHRNAQFNVYDKSSFTKVYMKFIFEFLTPTKLDK